MTTPPLRILFVGEVVPEAAAALTVATAAAIPEALEKAHSGEADVLLLDLAFASGLGAFATAKLAEGAPEIPLVTWATRDTEPQALRTLSAGSHDVAIAEDTGTDALRTLLRRAVDTHAARRRLAARAAILGVPEGATLAWQWEADDQLRFTWFSKEFARQLWTDPNRAIGHTPWDLDVLDQSPEEWDRCRDDVAGHRALRGILCSLHDERGQMRAFRISGKPLRDGEGRVVGYAGTGTDATREVEHSVRLGKVHEHLMDTMETMEVFRERLEADLAAARRMQQELLPSADTIELVASRYGVVIESEFETSDELGGDIWGLHPIDDHRFALYVADFSGHGVSAALNTFRLHAVIEHMVHGRENPGGYLQAINRRLAGLLPTGQYATVLYGVVDVTNDLMVYTAAAAPAPLLATENPCEVKVGDGAGLPLGVTTSATYETRILPFKSGELLFLYSDALIECGRENGKALGKEGVQDMLRDAVCRGGNGTSLSTILGPFFTRVDRPLGDDLTVVRCLRNGRG